MSVTWQDRQPELSDRTSSHGFDAHYVYHTAWAARILAELMPDRHVDISSYLYFSTLVSAFLPVDFYDYRPAAIYLSNLTTRSADLLSLPFQDRSVRSLSCMHVVEHVGLGRYGDALDPDGDLKAMAELQRVIAPGGSLLFVVPVGRPRVVFNAHRIYSINQVKSALGELVLQRFDLIPDHAREGMISNASGELADRQNFACGCFWFKRKE
ncbi:MAG TPA: DUF268 domain-containing protein [Armatimonadota bacterium]|nr:DUF268 domain-containing protein [Armatimonadota bacterium]